MIRRSSLHRVLSAVLLVWSTTVTAVLPAADAHVANAADTAAHVESTGSESCPPAHDELACQLCRGLRLAASGGPPLALPDAAGSVAMPASSGWSVKLSLRPGGTAARAPPVATS